MAGPKVFYGNDNAHRPDAAPATKAKNKKAKRGGLNGNNT
jgi:hypothetical protein